MNTTLKSIKPKIKVDADISKAVQKIKQIGKQKTTTTIQPKVDNSQVISSLKETQKETKSLFDRFLNGVVGVNLVRMSVQKVTQAIYQAITGLKELDKIKTDIQMVSGTSDFGVDAMMQSYNAMAKELSSTTKSVSETANEFLRMGESVASTNELIKSLQVLSKVGMIESSEAASYLISSLKGYKVEAEDSINIIDKLTSVDLEAAVSAGGLAEAMSRCANIANSSGTSMDRLIGYMATAGEVTQDSMSVIGNSFKSMYSRMNNIKIGRFIDDETGESLSDTEAVLDKLGIKLRDTKDTYRDFDDVLDDVGNNWKNFTQVEQNAISVAIAGTMQRERFIALMNNYSSALKYSETAANSAGSALERYGMYQDSIEAKTNELTAAIESLSTNTISEDLFSGIIQATTGVVEFIDKFGILKGTLAGLVTMGVSKMFVSMATGIVSAAKSTSQLTAAMAMFRNGRDVVNLRNIGAACKGLSDKQLKLILSTKGLINEDREQILTGMGVAEAEREQTLATLGLASAENTAMVSTFSLKNAWDALKIAVASNPIGATITAITTVVSVATMAFSFFNQQAEEAAQKAKEAASAYKETSSSIEEYSTKYKELREQLLAAKGNEEETYNVKKQLLDLQTELNDKFGEEHRFLNLVTGDYESQTEAIKELNKEEAKRFLNENEQGISAAERKMESEKTYDLSYAIAKTPDNEKFMEEIVGKYEKDGMSILDAGESFYIKLDANPKDAYETINAFMTDVNEKAKELGNENLFKDTVSNIASDSLNKAKETLDKYQEIYHQAQLANIASDDNLSEGYNEAVSAVESYNEAVLKSEDPYNDESVNKAWNNLQEVKQGIQDEAEWEKYSGVMDDVFSAANDDVYSFYQTLRNDTEIKKLAEDLKGLSDIDLQAMSDDGDNGDAFDILYAKAEKYGLEVQDLIDLLVRLGYVQGEMSKEGQETAQASSFQEAWTSLSTTEDENLKSLKEDLLSLAEAGQLTFEKFANTKGSDGFLSMLGIELDDTQEINSIISQINELKSSADQLSSMKKGISSLSENLYNRKQEPDAAIDADVLAGMDSVLKEQTAEWERYVTVLGDASSSMDDVQKATDELATAYVNSNNFLANLTDANKDYYISQLDAMGVANSAEIVSERLTAQMEVEKYRAQAVSVAVKDIADSQASYTQRSVDSVNATYENSRAFLEQSNMSDLAKVSLVNLIAQEQIYTSTTLSTSQKVNELNKLALAFLGVGKAVQISSAMGGDSRYWTSPEQYDAAVKEQFNNSMTNWANSITTVRTKPATTKNNGNKEKKENAKEEMEKEFSEVFDWIERRIKKFQRSFDKWVKQAETAVTTNFVNKYYKKAQSSAKSQLSTYGKAYNKYMRKANAVGLDEKYAKKVRNGTINIEEIYAKGSEDDVKKYEELADKIKEYQDWYDKAQDSIDSFMETAEKLYNLPLEKAARKVDIFRDAIDLLDKEIDNETDYTKKNKKIDKQTQKEKKILDANKTADTDTKKLLSSASKELRKNRNLNADDGITKKERKAIRKATKGNKEVNLSYFKENSAGYKAAIKYNEALKARKKAINEAKSAQQDYNAWVVEANKLKFDNIADYYDKQAQMLGYKMSALDNKVSEIESSGRKVHGSYYKEQKAINQNKLSQYIAEKAALEESLTHIKKGTDEWYDAYDQIQQISSSISDCTKETYELNDAISQLHFDMFDDTTESIKRIITEQEFLRGLFAHEKNMDKKTGGLTDAGLANLGSLSAGYYASGENATRLAAEVAELQRMLDAGKTYSSLLGIELNSIDNVEKRLNEARATEQEWIKERYDNASAIHDMMEELYQTELDYLKELIDAKKEALDAEKDLHDYQRTISEKTDEIATIQKQIAAYSGDTSEEGRAKLQRLQKELDDKKDDLKETEYDRYISDQKDMLDDLYDEYSKRLEEKLEDFMTLVQEGLEKADNNMSGIKDFLDKIASKNGYDTETKGLFDNSWTLDFSSGTISNNGIEQNVGNASSQVANGGKERYKSTKQQTVPFTDPVFEGNKLIEHESDSVVRANVKQYIGEAAIKAKKKKGEYSDVSQRIYENKAKSYKRTGKVLSTASMKDLAKFLGVKYDNASKNGRLYKKLKSIKFPGFKKGGEVSVDDIQKQVRANGDDGIVSVKNGEGILNPKETKGFKKLVQNADDATNALGVGELITVQPDILKSISDLAQKNITTGINGMVKLNMPDFRPVGTNNTTNIDIGGITMNGVNDPEELSRQIVRSIQKYPRAQKAIHATSTDILTGTGNALSIKSIR
ncbi:phage tail tape measure protein [uncultured Bacteroides sp.]|uniref:phage tail tape measure protein n=1 Tax=uncultured Bacteroides sp. TaxID=162156 RepID=UPI002620C4DB|nr:phage tail tape measure protein [uncultured Bacteroides sp.]